MRAFSAHLVRNIGCYTSDEWNTDYSELEDPMALGSGMSSSVTRRTDGPPPASSGFSSSKRFTHLPDEELLLASPILYGYVLENNVRGKRPYITRMTETIEIYNS